MHHAPHLIVYDGICVLCSRGAQFVAAHDPDGQFAFVPLQSAYGRRLAQQFDISPDDPQTFVAIIGGKALTRSDGGLEILHRLPGLAWTRLLRFVPRTIRDAVYDLVARHRYQWFGRYDACPPPPSGIAARVIEQIPQ